MSHYYAYSSNRKGPTIESLHHRVDNWSSDCPVDLVRCRRLSKHMVYIGFVVKTFFTPVSVPLTELEARVARCGRYDGILSLYRPFQSTLLPVGKKCHEREREVESDVSPKVTCPKVDGLLYRHECYPSRRRPLFPLSLARSTQFKLRARERNRPIIFEYSRRPRPRDTPLHNDCRISKSSTPLQVFMRSSTATGV